MLREIREKRAFTQAMLADSLKVDRSTVTKWETGENSPNAKTLLRIAEILNCTVNDILCPIEG